MRGVVAALLTLVLAGGSPLESQTPGSADFRPLEFLVGSCWIGTFPDGKRTDEHCFEWVFDRRFIRDRHVVRGSAPYQGETIYGWDSIAKQLSFWYWNSDGLLTVGRVEYTSEGIVFPERFRNGAGVEIEMKGVWSRVGADAYRVVQSQRAGDGWRTLWTMELTRKR